MNKAVLFLLFALGTACISAEGQASVKSGGSGQILDPGQYRHYIQVFERQEMEASGKQPDDPWSWLLSNIPWFDTSDKDFEEIYYMRWYAFQKHVVKWPSGYVVTEWIDQKDKNGINTPLADSAGHQIYEARWLRDGKIAEDYARYWAIADSRPRKYSFWWADSVYSLYLETGDKKAAVDLLPNLVANYQAWEQTNRDPNGLFWQIDTRDGMEKSISGSGYRPTLNSYMYGDAVAISRIATLAGNAKLAAEYAEKAKRIRQLVEEKLWNPRDRFYEVIQKSPEVKLADVRELLGYIPWEFDLPEGNSHAVAWKQLFDPQGFDGKYGPTTAERRSPRFNFVNPDQCKWNGPSWPYATTQTLIAFANLLNDYRQKDVSRTDYYKLFSSYVLSQHLKLPGGEVIPWIDENLDSDTGEWIARGLFIKQHSRKIGRGRYYNHSGFADPLITGLLGLRPQPGDTVVVNPLLPEKQWKYFAVDEIPYHGHLLALVYDPTGQRYHRGKGFLIFCDGEQIAKRSRLGPLRAKLPSSSQIKAQ